jgi:hypothetical protein
VRNLRRQDSLRLRTRNIVLQPELPPRRATNHAETSILMRRCGVIFQRCNITATSEVPIRELMANLHKDNYQKPCSFKIFTDKANSMR